MTALAQRVKETPMAPYMGLMEGMSRKQKLVVMAFLVDTMQEQEAKTEEPRQMLKPNPFKDFKPASEFDEDERARIKEKMRARAVSQEASSLIDGLSLTAEEMQDERTRYILGLSQ